MKKPWQLSRIGKEYHFSAAHHLPKLPEDHPCHRLHGHNYVVEIEVRGEISERNDFTSGLDFSKLDEAMKPLVAQLDHRLVNDVIESPTAERIAEWFMNQLLATTAKFIYSVKVWETPKCWAMVVNGNGYYHPVHRDD